MTVLCVGVDHRTAPLALRERLAWSIADAETLYRQFAAGQFADALPVTELALLSTCNRVELYGAVPDERAAPTCTDAMWSLLHRSRGGDEGIGDIVAFGYEFSGARAERHLCRVAAGLESLILGEAEILGQIADAFAMAGRAGASGSTLDALANAAQRAGRRARSETSIGRNPASVSSVAADVADTLAPALHGREVLIVGAGKMARIAAELLTARREWTIRIAGRTLEGARALAESVHGEPIAMEDIPEAMAHTDLVIACSASPTTILDHALMRDVMRGRSGRPLAILDIAVPRNVDPAVRSLPGVILHDVDELRPRVEESLARRREEVPQVEAIVDEELLQLITRRNGAALLGVVDAWRASAEETRRHEVHRALRAIPDGDEAVRDSLERLSVALVKRLLDEPSRRLRAQAANGHAHLYAEFARELFESDGGEAATSNRHASPAIEQSPAARA